MSQTETRKELIEKFDILITDNEDDLNTWEMDFLSDIEASLRAEDGFMTDKQIEKLEQIYEKYNK